jgi:hypothetical protein
MPYLRQTMAAAGMTSQAARSGRNPMSRSARPTSTAAHATRSRHPIPVCRRDILPHPPPPPCDESDRESR